MRVIKYSEKYAEDVKDLLVQLQEYIAEIDDWELNIMTPEYREEYFKHTLENCKNGAILLARDGDKTVGMICGSMVIYNDFDHTCYACPPLGDIHELVIDKTCRHKGVGSLLLSKMEEYFKKQGCEYCNIGVFEPNTAAKNLYFKKGYITRVRTLAKKL